MRALVLGGNGFIGSHIVDRLLAEGHSVRVFDRSTERFRDALRGVDYRFGSFNDTPALSEAMQDVDIIYHAISTTVPSTSNKDPVFDIESNLINTVRLLNLMTDSGVSRIVYLSSGGTVYGIPEYSPIKETHPLRPICSYGVVKIAIENYIHMYSHLHGLEYILLRASNPYGPRQGHIGVQGVIGTFMGKYLNDEDVVVWGDGSVVRDFIYIDDLVELIVVAGQSNISGILNAGSGVGSSINDVISCLKSVSGKNLAPVYRPGRDYDVPSIVLDMDKARTILNFSPSVSLEEGVMRTWEWMQKVIKE